MRGQELIGVLHTSSTRWSVGIGVGELVAVVVFRTVIDVQRHTAKTTTKEQRYPVVATVASTTEEDLWFGEHTTKHTHTCCVERSFVVITLHHRVTGRSSGWEIFVLGVAHNFELHLWVSNITTNKHTPAVE